MGHHPPLDTTYKSCLASYRINQVKSINSPIYKGFLNELLTSTINVTILTEHIPSTTA